MHFMSVVFPVPKSCKSLSCNYEVIFRIPHTAMSSGCVGATYKGYLLFLTVKGSFLSARINTSVYVNTVEPGYNDMGSCDVSSIASDIQWYEFIHHFVCWTVHHCDN